MSASLSLQPPSPDQDHQDRRGFDAFVPGAVPLASCTPFTTAQLTAMCESIEQMPKFNQVVVLRILTHHQVAVSENKNGVHVNLTDLPPAVLHEIQTYIRYVSDQEQYLTLADQKQKQCQSNLEAGPGSEDDAADDTANQPLS